MALYEITPDKLEKLDRRTFADLEIRERQDLQRLLRDQINVVDDLLVIAEEFGDRDESNRRIDLLALDRVANLVVVELKRTEHGGHMELQALRYAAMVSNMTFDQVVPAHARFLDSQTEDEARERILQFLDWREPHEEKFGAVSPPPLKTASRAHGPRLRVSRAAHPGHADPVEL